MGTWLRVKAMEKLAAELNQASRERIKEKNFAIPTGGPGGTGKYPIHDISHARNALTRVDQYGTPEEKRMVYEAVAKKYPGLASRSSVPGVQRAHDEEKEGCSSRKMAAMRMSTDFQKVADSLIRRIASMGNPMSHLGEHAYDVAGLGILAVPTLDKIQAMARARMAGESGDEEAVSRRRFIGELPAEAMELGGLGVLAVPSIGNLARGLRGAH
jgi:hypothetical protein